MMKYPTNNPKILFYRPNIYNGYGYMNGYYIRDDDDWGYEEYHPITHYRIEVRLIFHS